MPASCRSRFLWCPQPLSSLLHRTKARLCCICAPPLSASLVSSYLLTIPLCLDLPRHHRGTLIGPKDRLLYNVEGVSECLNSLACPKQRLNRCFGVGPGAADRRCSGKHHRQRGTHTIACCGGCGPRCGAAAAAGRGWPAYQQRNVEGCGLH